MVILLAMKTILAKIKIFPLTYLIILIFFLTGHIKNILIILSIILFHELGHIYFLIRNEFTIDKIEIYPFGGITKSTKLINTPINKDILIYLGGALFQLIMYLIYFILYKINVFHLNTFKLFLNYNTCILIFNLLPIRPLDGGELLKLILEKFFSYQKANMLANIVSFISLIIFILFNLKFNLNSYLVISYLLIKLIDLLKKQPIIFNKFLLERYLFVLPYKKIEHNNIFDPRLLKKDTLHFFKKDNRYYHEKEILTKRFDRNTYF